MGLPLPLPLCLAGGLAGVKPHPDKSPFSASSTGGATHAHHILERIEIKHTIHTIQATTDILTFTQNSKSKEDLFDFLVKEHADYIKGIYDQVYSDFSKLSLEEQINQMEDYSSVGLKHMFSYTWNHKKVFNLILNCADGTSYQNFLNEVAQREIVATEKFYDILKSQGIKCENLDPLMEEIIIKGTFSSLFTLCLLDIPYDQAQKSLDQMFRFYRGGWDSLMHFSKN